MFVHLSVVLYVSACQSVRSVSSTVCPSSVHLDAYLFASQLSNLSDRPGCPSVSLSVLICDHGLINYKDSKAKCRHLQKFTCKGTLRQVIITVYRMETQGDPALWTVAPLTFSLVQLYPLPCANTYTANTREEVFMEGPLEPNMGPSLADVLLCTFESTNAGFSSFPLRKLLSCE